MNTAQTATYVDLKVILGNPWGTHSWRYLAPSTRSHSARRETFTNMVVVDGISSVPIALCVIGSGTTGSRRSHDKHSEGVVVARDSEHLGRAIQRKLVDPSHVSALKSLGSPGSLNPPLSCSDRTFLARNGKPCRRTDREREN